MSQYTTLVRDDGHFFPRVPTRHVGEAGTHRRMEMRISRKWLRDHVLVAGLKQCFWNGGVIGQNTNPFAHSFELITFGTVRAHLLLMSLSDAHTVFKALRLVSTS